MTLFKPAWPASPPTTTTMATLSAVPAAKDDWHDRWLREMNKEYTRRLSMARTTFVGRCSRSDRNTATEMPSCKMSGNAPVYRSIKIGGSSGGSVDGHKSPLPASRRSSDRRSSGRQSAQWLPTNDEVDEEWKRSCPPLLQRQIAFMR